MARLVLLVTSPRVAPGLLSDEAWSALRSGPVFTVDDQSDPAVAVRDAGIDVRALGPDSTLDHPGQALVDAAVRSGTATWLIDSAGDTVVRALAAVAASGPDVQVEVVHGSWDLPGARLLDVVATMDRLRSPGGCPWDAEQDHMSLAPYLLEEAYEAFQDIEDGDLEGLRGELGDVLLQVAFHARLAEERPEGERWSIDDVATALVEKLVRRHPHVFGGVDVSGAAEVNANWEAIKAAERGSASAVSNVAMAAPALTLAATLQRKAVRAGIAGEPAATAPDLSAALAEFTGAATPETAGDLLWTLVASMQAAGIDAEAALRATARQFRDQVEAATAAAEID